MKYKLFTTKGCPKCPEVKEMMLDSGLLGENIDASLDDGFETAKRFGVMRVPTVILFDDNGVELKRLSEPERIKAELSS